MSEIGVVYASNDPTHIEDFKAWSERVAEWRQKCKAWAEIFDGEALIFQPAAWSPWTFEFAGLKSRYGSKPPTDWRVKKVGMYYVQVPKRSTRRGKDLAEQYDALKHSPELPNGQLAGMPSNNMIGLSIQSPSVRIIGERLYVAWADEPKPSPDFDLWSEIPRSEYYRVIEREEANA